MTTRPNYVYVASSWRNSLQPAVCAALDAAGIDYYDFRNPPNGAGFGWPEVKTADHPSVHSVAAKGSDWEDVDEYLLMIEHPRALEGFAADFDAMKRADTFVMVLPCGKSAHLELGWAVGAGKRTVILLEDPVEPELMYRMVDYMATGIPGLLAWLAGPENIPTSSLTTDPTDPRLGHGVDTEPGPQEDVYLVKRDLDEPVRTVRFTYIHAKELGGCGAVTTMSHKIAETYAVDPLFYGSTYCVGCRMHRPVGFAGEFYWDGTTDRVGT